MPFKELISKIHELFSGVIEAANMAQNSFIYNNLKFLEDIKTIAVCIRDEEKTLSQALLKEAKVGNPAAAAYMSIPAHLYRISGYIDSISSSLEKKIKGEVLFSDKAVSEVNFLFENLKDILSNTGDMILARNRIIAAYISEAEANISKTANDFSTKHEERLIEGSCLAAASSIYLELLSTFKAIAWHAKEVANNLKGGQ